MHAVKRMTTRTIMVPCVVFAMEGGMGIGSGALMYMWIAQA